MGEYGVRQETGKQEAKRTKQTTARNTHTEEAVRERVPDGGSGNRYTYYIPGSHQNYKYIIESASRLLFN